MPSIAVMLERVTTVAVLLAASAIVLQSIQGRSQSVQVPQSASVVEDVTPLKLTYQPPKALPAGATAIVLVFSDFECPFCAAFARDTVSQLRKAYVQTEKVALLYLHAAGNASHSNARSAASSAVCADEQNAFWPMHDLLFSSPAMLALAPLDQAARVGLLREPFANCLETAAARVNADLVEARRLGVSGTPTTFLGVAESKNRVALTRRVEGAVPFALLQPQIDALVR